MRFIGIDVHRDFCEVYVLAGGGEEQRRRVATRPVELEAFARELDRVDVVALETSGPATAVARVLEPYADRVVVIDPRGLVRAGARAKTDRLDARTLPDQPPPQQSAPRLHPLVQPTPTPLSPRRPTAAHPCRGPLWSVQLAR